MRFALFTTLVFAIGVWAGQNSRHAEWAPGCAVTMLAEKPDEIFKGEFDAEYVRNTMAFCMEYGDL